MIFKQGAIHQCQPLKKGVQATKGAKGYAEITKVAKQRFVKEKEDADI